MKSYDEVHEELQRTRGKASTHLCVDCGGKAQNWSYQYTGEVEYFDEAGRVYCEDFSCYAARCVGCHFRFDRTKEKRLRDVVAGHARRLSANLAERRKTDPLLDQRMREASLRNLAKAREAPDYKEKVVAAGKLGGAARTRKLREDPEFAARASAASRKAGLKMAEKVNNLRESCSCGLETTPGPMARHKKASGHS